MKIITDSAADLSPTEAAQWGIHVVPLSIQFPEGEVLSSDISHDEFYRRLQAMVPDVPSTSQPSVGTLLENYQKAGSDGEPLLAIHVSSGLSGTYQTATMAAQQYPGDVTTVDTMTLSVGQRFQVLAAAMALKAGWSKAEILERLDAIRASTEAMFTLETLEYLARGGRIGRVQALAGSILKIKPIIHVDKADGKYSTLGRGRTLGQTMGAMENHLKTAYKDEPVWVTVLHGQMADKAEAMSKMLRSSMNVAKLDVIRISPVLGVHTGPGIVGAGAVPMRLFEDLNV